MLAWADEEGCDWEACVCAEGAELEGVGDDWEWGLAFSTEGFDVADVLVLVLEECSPEVLLCAEVEEAGSDVGVAVRDSSMWRRLDS